jgi:hypothetical protein
MSDSIKCKLINLKEDLNVFLLNRAVNFSISQTAVRTDLEECLDFLKTQIGVIQEARTLKVSENTVKECCIRIERVRSLRLSANSHKKLLQLCEAYAARALILHSLFGKPFPEKNEENIKSQVQVCKAQEDVNDKRILQVSDDDCLKIMNEWKILLKDLRNADRLENASFFLEKEYTSLKCRVKKYENDLILLRHKNEYRDLIYMAFYNLRKKVKLVSQDLIDNSENYAFYDDINKTEATLRQNIQEIYDLHPALLNTISKKTLSPLSASASASASVSASVSASISASASSSSSSASASSASSSSSSTTSSIDGFVKRGGPKYCPGYGLHKIHLCAPKTKFFPCGVDKVERCLECHEQAMREYGGRIQIAKVKKQSTSEKSSEPVRFKLKC